MLRLRVFGGLALDRDGRALDMGSQRKGLALLAVVAVAGTVGISRDRLLSLFWPESDEDRARNALRQRLFTLRRVLEIDELLVGGADLRLNTDVLASDVAEFEAALALGDVERAASLYAGPLLDGIHLRDTPDLERWVEAQRSRFSHRAERAMTAAAAAAAARGDPHAALRWWRLLVAVAPTSAEANLGLLEALDATGDSAGALDHLRNHEVLLRLEYDLPVDDRVRAAAERIRTRAGPRAQRPGIGQWAAQGNPIVAEPAEEQPGESGSPTAQAESSPRSGSRWPLWRGLGLGAVATAAGLAFLAAREERRTPSRVLVASFVNETGDTTYRALGMIAAEWATQELARVGLAEVVDPRTVVWVRGDSSPVARARELGARTLVLGSFHRRADSLVAHARITDVARGTVVQTLLPVAAPADSPMVLVDRLRARVSGALAVLGDARFAGTPAPLTSLPTYDAYREFVSAMEWGGRHDWGRAIPHLLEAVRLDSGFVRAALWVAEVVNDSSTKHKVRELVAARRGELAPYDRAYFELFLANDSGGPEAAYVAARRLVELAPASPDANYRFAYAALASRRYDESVRTFDKVEASPGWMRDWWFRSGFHLLALHLSGDLDAELALGHRLGRRFPRQWEVCRMTIRPLAALGRLDEAVRRVEECADRENAPHDDVPSLLQVARELQTHGHRVAADSLRRRAVAKARALRANGAMAPTAFASVLYEGGEWAESLPMLRAQLDTTRNARPRTAGVAAVAAARAGDGATAKRLREWLERHDDAERRPMTIVWLAQVAASEGRTADAIRLLRAARTRRLVFPLVLHPVDPGFEALIGRREFEALTRER